MAVLSRQKSETGEVWGDFDAVELDATPIARAPPNERTNWPPGQTVGSRLSESTPTSCRSGPFSEPDNLQADSDNDLHDTTYQATSTDQRWQQAYSILTDQAPPARI